jgi:hypothetical protein
MLSSFMLLCFVSDESLLGDEKIFNIIGRPSVLCMR